MKSSDIQKLSDAYTKILTEDVGLGGHVSGTNTGSIVMGIGMPDNNADKSAAQDSQRTETQIKSAIEEVRSIFGELKNAEGLEPWVASKLSTAADRINFMYNYLIGTNR